MDELDRLREDNRAMGRIAREARAGVRKRDEALADIERIAGRQHVELTQPRRSSPEVLSEPAIAEDLRRTA